MNIKYFSKLTRIKVQNLNFVESHFKEAKYIENATLLEIKSPLKPFNFFQKFKSQAPNSFPWKFITSCRLLSFLGEFDITFISISIVFGSLSKCETIMKIIEEFFGDKELKAPKIENKTTKNGKILRKLNKRHSQAFSFVFALTIW